MRVSSVVQSAAAVFAVFCFLTVTDVAAYKGQSRAKQSSELTAHGLPATFRIRRAVTQRKPVC